MLWIGALPSAQNNESSMAIEMIRIIASSRRAQPLGRDIKNLFDRMYEKPHSSSRPSSEPLTIVPVSTCPSYPQGRRENNLCETVSLTYLHSQHKSGTYHRSEECPDLYNRGHVPSPSRPKHCRSKQTS